MTPLSRQIGQGVPSRMTRPGSPGTLSDWSSSVSAYQSPDAPGWSSAEMSPPPDPSTAATRSSRVLSDALVRSKTAGGRPFGVMVSTPDATTAEPGAYVGLTPTRR